MDVIPVSRQDASEELTRIAPADAPHTTRRDEATPRGDSPAAVAQILTTIAHSVSGAPHIVPELSLHERAASAAPTPEDHSNTRRVFEFDLASNDVLARFWIDDASKKVVITLYQRDTGEIIRETPPRAVLDTVAALEGIGLAVNTVR